MPKNIDYIQLLQDFIKAYGTNILSATIMVIAGYLAGGYIARIFDGLLQKRQLEPPIRILIVRVVRIIILAFSFLLAAQNLGFQIMPLIAGLGVAGVGVGLAMQGVLGNAIAGLTIIFLKPYRVGEYIEILGEQGEVITIELFNTTLAHADKSRVVVPNRKIVGEILHNYGSTRQLDLTVGVSYATDLSQAIQIIQQVLAQNPRILKEPVPVVGVTALADSSINISVKPWVNVKDYGAAQVEIYQAIINQFRARGIEIPFPQREVRILGNNAAAA